MEQRSFAQLASALLAPGTSCTAHANSQTPRDATILHGNQHLQPADASHPRNSAQHELLMQPQHASSSG